MLGSAGSNRIRSALLQVIVNVHRPRAWTPRPRSRRRACTGRTACVYAEPGIDLDGARGRAGYALAPFRERNLFFGGCQAVERDR